MNQNLKLSSALKTKVHTLSLLYSDPFMIKITDCEDNYTSAQEDNFTGEDNFPKINVYTFPRIANVGNY